jgi:hypothetical protein
VMLCAVLLLLLRRRERARSVARVGPAMPAPWIRTCIISVVVWLVG